jgi:hypothetical protein
MCEEAGARRRALEWTGLVASPYVIHLTMDHPDNYFLHPYHLFLILLSSPNKQHRLGAELEKN